MVNLMSIQEVCFSSIPFAPCLKCPFSLVNYSINPIYCTFICRTRRRISPVNSGVLQGWVSLDHQKNLVLAYQYAQENKIQGFSKKKKTKKKQKKNKKAGRKWMRLFLSRHPEVRCKKAHNLSVNRAMCSNPAVFKNGLNNIKGN